MPSELELDNELSHHLRDVLRMSEGRQLTVVCKKSAAEYSAIVAEAALKKPVKIKIIARLAQNIYRPVVSSLICALPKGQHPDQICEQVSQFAVEKIILWQAERSDVKLNNPDNKLERWRKIAEASARQSQSARIPEVIFFSSTAELFGYLAELEVSQNLLLLCSLSASAKKISDINVSRRQLHLVVGPEGDFTEQEEQAFLKLGAEPITLGKQILRVETAAVAAVAACSVCLSE